MSDHANESKNNQGAPSLQSEFNAAKRKMARLQREYDNLLQMYKQAMALREYNEKEKEIQMQYNQMLRDNSPDDLILMDVDGNVYYAHRRLKNALETI